MLVLAAVLIRLVSAAFKQAGDQVVPAPFVMVVRAVHRICVEAGFAVAEWFIQMDKVCRMCRVVNFSARLAIFAQMEEHLPVCCCFGRVFNAFECRAVHGVVTQLFAEAPFNEAARWSVL